MSPLNHLAAINFFIGDIQGGLGPFLSTWLAQVGHWSPARIGSVTTIVGLATLALNGPAGLMVDRLAKPRVLLGVACAAILVGTLLILPARGFTSVLVAQFLAASGGTLLMPALTSLTLGIVGKDGFTRQQGRNQASNHIGILSAAVLVGGSTTVLGPGAAFWVLSGMAVAAGIAIATTPASAWNGRRAHGWDESEPDEQDRSHPIASLFWNRRLLLLAAALASFNLSNGSMLGLLGQRSADTGGDATGWMAAYVIVAQLTMVPTAIWAGSLSGRRVQRRLLLVACAVLPIRAVMMALVTDPYWLIGAEVLDGVASGLLGVTVPVLVADLTWGTGRTQTALGVVNTIQGVGGALSGVFGGILVSHLGWSGAFLALAVPPVLGFGIGLWIRDTGGASPPVSPNPLVPPKQTPAPAMDRRSA